MIAFERTIGAGRAAVYTIRPDGSSLRRLWAPPAGDAHAPVWSPDGSLLAVAVLSGERRRLWLVDADGSDPRLLVDDPYEPTPDGKQVVHEGGGEPSTKVAITGIDGGTRYGNYGSDPVWAPRGQLIAYQQLVRLSEGRPQLFLLDARTMSGRRLTADVGGREGADNYQPAWSPAATAIAFASSPRRETTPDGGIALGPGELRLVDADGTNERRLTHQCLLGSDRRNRLTGTRLNDVILARGGNDAIDGRAGPDLIVAGAGSDRIAARDGTRDRIVCRPGRDVAEVDRRDVVARDCELVSRG